MKSMQIMSRALVCGVLILSALRAQAGFIAEDGALERVTQSSSAQTGGAPRAVPAAPVGAPAAVQAPPAAQAVPASQIWVARKGSSLRKTVEEWGRISNWEVIWKPADLNYDNPVARTFAGSFETAVKELFAPYKQSRRPLWVDGWRGNSVLVITENIDQNQ